MNNLLASSELVGPFRILLAVLNATAYGCLTVAAGVGLVSLWESSESLRAKRQHAAIQSIRAGFLLLSMAQISHSIWTTFSWGEYWAWDPAKNLGLLAWLVYAGVLHMHHVPSLKGRKVILASLVGWSLLAGVNIAFAAFVK